MHAFDILGDPVRRRILEILSSGEHASGELVSIIHDEFGISQPAVSQHLKVLRNNGFAHVAINGTRRIYALDTTGLEGVDKWLAPFRQFWAPKFEALATEIARGKRKKNQRRDT